MDENFVQIGVTAMRNKETGLFGAAIPLFAKACDVQAGAGTVDLEEVAALFTARMESCGNGI